MTRFRKALHQPQFSFEQNLAVANIRLTLAYDGTDYVGWQIQPRGRTVQGELEAAIKELSGESLRVLAAGRTDSGVHALRSGLDRRHRAL